MNAVSRKFGNYRLMARILLKTVVTRNYRITELPVRGVSNL